MEYLLNIKKQKKVPILDLLFYFWIQKLRFYGDHYYKSLTIEQHFHADSIIFIYGLSQIYV